MIESQPNEKAFLHYSFQFLISHLLFICAHAQTVNLFLCQVAPVATTNIFLRQSGIFCDSVDKGKSVHGFPPNNIYFDFHCGLYHAFLRFATAIREIFNKFVRFFTDFCFLTV